MAEETKKKRALPKGRHQSQIKRERQTLKRHARNVILESSLKTSIKKVKEAAQKKNKTLAQTLLIGATQALYKAASKGVIHSRNASRRVSRLASLVHSLS